MICVFTQGNDLSCLHDGHTGGIMSVFVQHDFELNYDGRIDLNGKGYIGGTGGAGGPGAMPTGSPGSPGFVGGGNGGDASGTALG